ncbi:MAG: NYN domain-containing protein [Acidobacteria bacterium]|nr:NYN domain-containing protein [Acidobacteriota bacterium]
MNVPADTRSTRIAVFIDFDNVEIGVKNTIGGQFDIGLVLEAIKERGEIVTKIAYSDWKRAGDYSRLLTQHAIRMVQRNMTPGGDKNGADITMALDALEMAFTHNHINAFVIVGGDSDFISLVEKLKQYGRKVIVVGGRQFTSSTMQQNCHEFIAYENLVGTRGGIRQVGRGARPSAAASGSPVTKALPLIMRALKVLSDREVTPQLGLLKSTLLQLDSTFSEREYGAGSFRDFMEKVAAAGAVTLRESGRSMLVEAVADAEAMFPAVSAPAVESNGDAAVQVPLAAAVSVQAEGDEEALPASPMTPQDGMRTLQAAFGSTTTPPRWPMYVRQAKQFLRNVVEGFDERNYGFSSVVDLLRAAGKEGILRVERDRQGAVRVFAGPKLTVVAAPVAEPESVETSIQEESTIVEEMVEEMVAVEVEVVTEIVLDALPSISFDPIIEDIEDGELTQSAAAIAAAGIPGSAVAVGQKKPRRREPAKAAAGAVAAATRPPRPRARKTGRAKPAAGRS